MFSRNRENLLQNGRRGASIRKAQTAGYQHHDPRILGVSTPRNPPEVSLDRAQKSQKIGRATFAKKEVAAAAPRH